MNERDIIIDPIITHNNYLIEVAPNEFVNVTQLWKEYKQIVKDKKDLQNRINKAIEYIEKNFDEYSEFVFGIKLKNEILNILKESGE